MSKSEEFNSKEELDNLMELFNSGSPTLPSEVLKLYAKVENFLVRIHQLGYTKGYEKGVNLKNRLKDIS